MPTQFITIHKNEYTERKDEIDQDNVKKYPVYAKGMQVICFCLQRKHYTEIVWFDSRIFLFRSSGYCEFYVHPI